MPQTWISSMKWVQDVHAGPPGRLVQKCDVFPETDKEQKWQAVCLNHYHAHHSTPNKLKLGGVRQGSAKDVFISVWERGRHRGARICSTESPERFMPMLTWAMKGSPLSRVPSEVSNKSLVHSCSLVRTVARPLNHLDFRNLRHSPALISSGWHRGQQWNATLPVACHL